MVEAMRDTEFEHILDVHDDTVVKLASIPPMMKDISKHMYRLEEYPTLRTEPSKGKHTNS